MEENIQEPVKKSFFTQHIKGKYLILSLLLLIVLISILLVIVFLSKTERVVENQTTQTSGITSTESPKISIACPTVKSFCDKKEEIIKDGKIVGLRAMFAKETPIYAVFDGTVQARTVETKTKYGVEEYNKISLISKDNKFIAEYFFKNVKVTKYMVKKGEIIFYIKSLDTITSKHGNYNFIFMLLDEKARPVNLDEVKIL